MVHRGFITCAATIIASTFLASPAFADLTFAQWARGPVDKRAIYVAGVMETVGVYAEVLGFVDGWTKCLATLRLSHGAVSEGALQFATERGGMDSEPAPAVLIAYMNQRCRLNALRKP